jgi:hypothetical protein
VKGKPAYAESQHPCLYDDGITAEILCRDVCYLGCIAIITVFSLVSMLRTNHGGSFRGLDHTQAETRCGL